MYFESSRQQLEKLLSSIVRLDLQWPSDASSHLIRGQTVRMQLVISFRAWDEMSEKDCSLFRRLFGVGTDGDGSAEMTRVLRDLMRTLHIETSVTREQIALHHMSGSPIVEIRKCGEMVEGDDDDDDEGDARQWIDYYVYRDEQPQRSEMDPWTRQHKVTGRDAGDGRLMFDVDAVIPLKLKRDRRSSSLQDGAQHQQRQRHGESEQQHQQQTAQQVGVAARHFMQIHVSLSSLQYDHVVTGRKLDHMAHMSDSRWQQEIDHLLPYNIYQQDFIESKLSLAMISKPIALTEAIRVVTVNKLFNDMTDRVFVTVENVDPLQRTLVVSNIALHLSKSTPLSANHRSLRPTTTTTTTTTTAAAPLQKPNTVSRLGTAEDPALTHRCVVENKASHFPITLLPFEQYCVIMSISPTSRFEHRASATPPNSNNAPMAPSYKSVTGRASPSLALETGATRPRRGSFQKRYLDQTSAANAKIASDEFGMTVFESTMSVEYEVEGMDTPLHKSQLVEWVSVLPRGLFAQIKIDPSAENVLVREPFPVSVLLTNHTNRVFDLLVTNQLLSSSTLICQDACANVGLLEPNSTKHVNLRFIAVEEGFHTFNELYCFNRITRQYFVFPLTYHVHVIGQ